MSWPASTQTLKQAFEDGDKMMIRLKATANRLATQSASQEIARKKFLYLSNDLGDLIAQMELTISYGVAARDYARAEYRLPALDVATEYGAVRTQAIALKTWIDNRMADGLDLTEKHGSSVQDLTFTVEQMSGFAAQATAFANTIA